MEILLRYKFYPMDEQLVTYYLRRKVARCPIDIIAEIDLYKQEPWDLLGMSHFLL